jgi:TetR/AcrR family transcriptional regulator, transcriptional repressor for nem operon
MARPRQFDEQAVLETAMEIFWARGYEATSTRDLGQAMGLTPTSLYNTFGDKRRLFRRAFDHYLRQTLDERITRLEGGASPGLAITTFFSEIIERSLGDARQRGCLLVNTALEATPAEPELLQAVGDELKEIERFFAGRLAAARRAGEIQAAQAGADAARQLLAVLMGVRVFARVRPERGLLSGAVRQTLRDLGLPPLPAVNTRKNPAPLPLRG